MPSSPPRKHYPPVNHYPPSPSETGRTPRSWPPRRPTGYTFDFPDSLDIWDDVPPAAIGDTVYFLDAEPELRSESKSARLIFTTEEMEERPSARVVGTSKRFTDRFLQLKCNETGEYWWYAEYNLRHVYHTTTTVAKFVITDRNQWAPGRADSSRTDSPPRSLC